MKKKLTILTDNFKPRIDGVASFLNSVIPGLKDHFDITVICPEFPGDVFQTDDITIVRFPITNLQFGDYTPAKPFLRRMKYFLKDTDIVFAQTIGPIGYFGIKYAKKLNKPIIGFTHSIEWELVGGAIKGPKFYKKIVEKIVKKLAVRTYNKCDLLLVPSSESADKFTKAGVKTIKTIVHLGVNTNKFSPSEDKNQSKIDAGIDPGYFVIGYVGRLSREKNLVTLLRAFMQLQKYRDDVKLLIVGTGVKDQIDLFKNKENIIMTGATNQVPKYLRAMDMYVLPSLTETTSLSTLEAMSCGLPVIVTKLEAFEQYIVDKYNGLFFPTQNSYVLRKKLELLMKNKDLRLKLGVNARKTIETTSSWSRTIESILEALKKF